MTPELNRLIDPQQVGRESADRLWDKHPHLRSVPLRWRPEMVEEMARDGYSPELVQAIQRATEARWEELRRLDRLADRITFAVVLVLLVSPGLLALLFVGHGWQRAAIAIATLLQWGLFAVSLLIKSDDLTCPNCGGKVKRP